MRLGFVDTLRGFAVICMIPLHTSHGWMQPGHRSGNLWNTVQFFGGLAAPIFLSLSGVSLGLRWAADAKKGRMPRYRQDLARALQLVVLGYAMRLQMWIIDSSGYAQPGSYLAQALLLGSYGLGYVAAGRLPIAPRRAFLPTALAVTLAAAGLHLVYVQTPGRLTGLLRVDVLQCIGASLACVILAGAARGSAFARPALYVGCGVVIVWLTVWTRSWVPGPLPTGVAAYLGQWPGPPGKPVMGLFPLFPWTAYTFIGTALGLGWARAAERGETGSQLVGYCAAGATLALLTCESVHTVFQLLAHEPWLTQPVRVAYRIGLVLVLSGIAAVLGHARSPLRAPLDLLGRHSLLVYWVHLEFAFGAASHRLAKALGPGAWALATALLVTAMLLLAYARVHLPTLRSRTPRAAAR